MINNAEIFKLQFATQEQILEWSRRNCLTSSEQTIVLALQDFWSCLQKNDSHYMRKNLEDIRDHATPRLRGMIRSVNQHLREFRYLNFDEHLEYWQKHCKALSKAINCPL